MLDIASTILCDHGQTPDTCPACQQNTHIDLISNLDGLLAAARPRLLRLTRLNGVPLDAADDVVQETLMEAWRHLNNLREPDRFDAWLDGICRNVCWRHARSQGADTLHQVHLSGPYLDTLNELEDDIADPTALDPVDELSRQDLAVLLDRAMDHLPDSTREIVELCYLAEQPQREVAVRLGLSIGALEARLHRARRQLRQILHGELRAEAESFGMLNLEPSMGWRETREWCWLCGKHHMRGIFEQHPDGHTNFRLRCPGCSPRYDMDIINSSDMFSMDGVRSFRPAIKRVLQVIPQLYMPALLDGLCLSCREPAQVKVMSSDEVPLPPSCPTIPGRFWIVSDCQKCGICATDVVSVFASHPLVLRFIEQHRRFVTEPGELVVYAGQSAICSRLTDITSAERLTILAHPQTLQVLATFLG